MTEHSLRDCRILVVEDEYLLADDLRAELSDAQAVVIGPVGTLDQALGLIEGGEHIDCAVLDVNLGGEMAYPAADLLLQQKVPVVFTTGYDDAVIPNCFADVVRCQKPVNIRQVTRAIGRMVHA